MGTFLSFGEIMLRLSPPGYERLAQCNSLLKLYGGAEANVAVALANYGLQSAYVSKIPDNPIGQGAINALRSFGVDTSRVVRGGERLGVYYCEKGASVRSTMVVYDRKHSAIADAQASDFDWPSILEGVEWLHWTGITPALGENVAAITEDALKAAKERGIAISCDLNYRANLWSLEKASEALTKLAPYVDLLIANEEHAAQIFGIRAEGGDDAPEAERYTSICRQMASRFGCKQIGLTMRQGSSASDNTCSGMLYDAKGDSAHFSTEYQLHLVDRVGGGDAFGAGLIYGMATGMDPQEAVEFGAAASALKQTIEGDLPFSSAKETIALMEGHGTGRVLR